MTGFHMQTEDRTMKSVNDQPSGNLPFLKPDDIQYFDKLLVSVIAKLKYCSLGVTKHEFDVLLNFIVG